MTAEEPKEKISRVREKPRSQGMTKGSMDKAKLLMENQRLKEAVDLYRSQVLRDRERFLALRQTVRAIEITLEQGAEIEGP